ncbi:UDP-N-acetylmuramoyl-L-alanine--D-glutamate ligase [Alteribacillus sp. HJP-4]|uniref:UDP-N-acetylmuramoyl-L-alanine--D-glutamate ligase n=1 Tax=Alteribacillus sp. HJP-4 TaxID=2775394 RepID=UPI0035CCD601
MKFVDTFQHKKILVLGLAKSGYAAARLIKQLGASVIVNDANDLSGSPEEKELKQLNIELVSGSHPLSLLDDGVEYIVKNPGIRYDNPLVKKALSFGIPVVTEVELAGMICEGSIIAISGSNGKTTTTSLIHEILQAGGTTSHIAGNIGKVACEIAQNVEQSEVMVTELSSFQLKGTKTFQPNIAVLLNIFDAHLDYHGGRKDYEMSKGKMFANMTKDDFAVYNADDPASAKLAEASEAVLVPFSVTKEVTEGAYVSGDMMYFRNIPVLSVHEAALPGRHNLENMLAAIAASMLYGAEAAHVKEVLMTFQGIRHRLQFAGEVEGRKVYNDSKATNMLSTQKAIEAFTDPVVLIGGGLDRGNEFNELIPHFQTLKGAVFFGQTKAKLADAAKKAGLEKVKTVESIEEAVTEAYQYTETGDILLLSPACASWDQFKTFEDRGEAFLTAIKTLS